MRQLHIAWNEQQQNLIENGVSASDVVPLQRAQKLTKLIDTLKQHGGPLNSDEEIDEFLLTNQQLDAKRLGTMLNDEIHFWQDSNLRYSVAQGCYLYRQCGITNEVCIKNLHLLVQRPDARSSAMLDDLHDVHSIVTQQDDSASPSVDTQQDDSASSSSSVIENIPDFVSHHPWPPTVGEYLAVILEEGLNIVEVVKHQGNVLVSCHFLKKYEIEGYDNLSLWIDSDADPVSVEKSAVLPVRPIIELVPSLSTMT